MHPTGLFLAPLRSLTGSLLAGFNNITGIYRTLPDITAEMTFPARPSPPDLMFHPSIFLTRKYIHYRKLLAGLLTTYGGTYRKKDRETSSQRTSGR